MQLLDLTNAATYLTSVGLIFPGEGVEIKRLAGGVSNAVYYVARGECDFPDFVLKQARQQLRVPDPWFCGVERIWREADVLRICSRVLQHAQQKSPDLEACTPSILFEDRDNYCFVMQAAPAEHRVWKELLLAGNASVEIARQCGRLLGVIHAGTWKDAEAARQLEDRKVFDELRIDPYYRTVASRFPESRQWFEELIESVWNRRFCLTHADFSPKNLLVYPGGLMMVDFETGHYGDPAFDLGFFLSHLVLKAVHHSQQNRPDQQFMQLAQEFLNEYEAIVRLCATQAELTEEMANGMRNLAGCIWARVDGKSQVEYLADERTKQQLRKFCREVFQSQPQQWRELLPLLSG